jgi:hypothetical protein
MGGSCGVVGVHPAGPVRFPHSVSGQLGQPRVGSSGGFVQLWNAVWKEVLLRYGVFYGFNHVWCCRVTGRRGWS